jgi:hypothetical protein
MDRSDSAFSLSVFTDAQELVKEWARMVFTAERARHICQPEYTLLLDGRDADHELCHWEDGADCDDVTGDTWSSLERMRVEELLRAELKSLADAKKAAEDAAAAAAAAKAEAERLVAEQKAAAAKEARDRRDYARLSAKFAGTPVSELLKDVPETDDQA